MIPLAGEIYKIKCVIEQDYLSHEGYGGLAKYTGKFEPAEVPTVPVLYLFDLLEVSLEDSHSDTGWFSDTDIIGHIPLH